MPWETSYMMKQHQGKSQAIHCHLNSTTMMWLSKKHTKLKASKKSHSLISLEIWKAWVLNLDLKTLWTRNSLSKTRMHKNSSKGTNTSSHTLIRKEAFLNAFLWATFNRISLLIMLLEMSLWIKVSEMSRAYLKITLRHSATPAVKMKNTKKSEWFYIDLKLKLYLLSVNFY